MMQPAPEGTGVIAGGADACGVRSDGNDQRGCQGARLDQSLQHRACDDQRLLAMSTPSEIAAKRGKTVEEILG
jgi:small subunit ribosomal protein S5